MNTEFEKSIEDLKKASIKTALYMLEDMNDLYDKGVKIVPQQILAVTELITIVYRI